MAVLTLAATGSAFLTTATSARAQGFSGSITGTAFRDFNSNGQMDTTRTAASPAEDVGVSGVTVTAYDSTGVQVGRATTGLGGTYTLSFGNSASPQVRVEFGVPGGFSVGPVGTAATGIQSGGDVQFVPTGGTANIGLVAPGDYCDSDPTIVVPCQQGAIDQQDTTDNLAPTNEPALFSYAYDTSGDYSADDLPGNSSTVMRTAATVAQIGSTWGVGTYSLGESRYSLEATYFKRYAELGDGGNGSLGAIYITDLSSTVPNGTTWVNVPDAGTDPRPGVYGVPESGMTFAQWDDDTPGYEDADEIGLGGMSISPDERTLYVVNLNDESLYAIPLIPPSNPGGPPTAGTPTQIRLPLTLPGATQGCTDGFVRPFAVQAELEDIYVGLTCTGPHQADLRGYVYAINAATDVVASKPALEIPFDPSYARGGSVGSLSAAWEPWTGDTYETNGTTGSLAIWSNWPQPLVSSLSFDAYGNMTVAVLDRNGSQVGSFSPAPGTTTPDRHGVTAGDLLLACTNQGGTFTLESDGSCPSATEGVTLTAGGPGNPDLSGVGGVGSQQGPGGGEFYFQHYTNGSAAGGGGTGTVPASKLPTHDHTGEGGVAQVPGFADVVTTHFDPISPDIYGGDSYYLTNGTVLESNSDGGDDSTGGGTIITSANSVDNESQTAFGKGDGLGDVAVLCSQAPVEIGSRVWIDANGNGIEDPGEQGVAGVTVTLENSTGTVLATTTTDSNGDYLFDDADVSSGLSPSTPYIVAVDSPTDFDSGGDLNGYQPTVEGAGTDSTINSKGQPGSVGATAALSSPSVGADLDIDFGFTKTPTCAVGDTAFIDTNGDGVQDDGEAPLAGVTVTLYAADGVRVSDTVDGTALSNPVTTDTNGHYLFDSLACGDYYETFQAPPGSGLRPSPTVAPAIGSVRSQPTGNGKTAVFDLDAALGDNEPSSAYSTQALLADTIDPTVDAGFQPADCSVGSTAFVDDNGDGVRDGTEPPLAGVRVTLYDAATHTPVVYEVDGVTRLPNPTVTDRNGYYLFDDLPCGNTYYETFAAPSGYRVTQAVPPSLSATDSQPDSAGTTPDFTLTYTASAVTSPADDLNEASGDFTVPSGEPTVGAETINPSVDAGYQLSSPPSCAVGDTTFVDTTGTGVDSSVDPPLAGVTVTIFDAATGQAVTSTLGGSPLTNPVTTNGAGHYLFDDLACGEYYESFSPPAGYSATKQLTPPSAISAVDSQPSPSSDRTPDFTLGVGAPDNEPASRYSTQVSRSTEVDPAEDAGFVGDGKVTGTVFLDSNKNGVQDPSEPGIGEITVTLVSLRTGDVVATTRTGSVGGYSFSNVPPGSYEVLVTKPTGDTFTTSSTGTVSVPIGGTGIVNAGLVPPAPDTTIPANMIPTAVPAGSGLVAGSGSSNWPLFIALTGLMLTLCGGSRLVFDRRARQAGF